MDNTAEEITVFIEGKEVSIKEVTDRINAVKDPVIQFVLRSMQTNDNDHERHLDRLSEVK